MTFCIILNDMRPGIAIPGHPNANLMEGLRLAYGPPRSGIV